MIIEQDGKRYVELTRKCIGTKRMNLCLAPQYKRTAKCIGGTVSKGIRLALYEYKSLYWDWAKGKLKVDIDHKVTYTGGNRACITITEISKKEAMAISGERNVVLGIRIALEQHNLYRDN